MNLKNMIAALLAGTALAPEEREELQKFDPESMQQELASLRSRVEEAENAKLSSEELLQKQLKQTIAERDSLKQEHARLERRELLHELAARSGCTDAEYLDFAAAKRQVDLHDSNAAAGLIAELEKSSPHCFRSRLQPGGGSGGIRHPEFSGSAEPASDRISRIISGLDHVPDKQ